MDLLQALSLRLVDLVLLVDPVAHLDPAPHLVQEVLDLSVVKQIQKQKLQRYAKPR